MLFDNKEIPVQPKKEENWGKKKFKKDKYDDEFPEL
jgi:hypothetical protein